MQNSLLFFEQGLRIQSGDWDSDCFYRFDYDLRTPDVKMDFQHYHKHYEIFLLVDENAGYVVEGDRYAILQSDMVLVKPFLQHKTEYNMTSRRLVISFRLSPSLFLLETGLQEMLQIFEEDSPAFRFADSTSEKLTSVLNDIFTINKTASPLQELMTYNKLMEFLYVIYQERGRNRYIQQNTTDSMLQKIYTLTSYIQANYAQELNLEQLAQRIYASPHYLSHQFRKITGFTLVNYIQTTRVRNAQHYLLYTNMRISDIAERCGFTSFSHFNRVFNKYCGISPSGFRSNGSQTVQHEALIEI